MNTMLLVGITGRSGSGKSSVAAFYAEKGYRVVDADRVSREIAQPGSVCLAELAAAFGPQILAPEGTLQRQKLAEIAFASPEKTEQLVHITHPHIIASLLASAQKAREAGEKLFFVDGAVIVGAEFEQYCDKIIVVTASLRLSISRIILRDGISKTAASRRLAAQLPERALRAAADYTIENNASEEALRQKAEEVLQALLQKEA